MTTFRPYLVLAGAFWVLPFVLGVVLSSMSENGNNGPVANMAFFVAVFVVPLGLLVGAGSMLAVVVIQVVQYIRARHLEGS